MGWKDDLLFCEDDLDDCEDDYEEWEDIEKYKKYNEKTCLRE